MEPWQFWFDLVRALAAVAVPVVVAWIAYRLNHRIKLWEASQWRNQELIKARLTYYQALAPALNDLMCYFTFIGCWKELSPQDVVRIKRTLDREFFSALPLFSEECERAYSEFMAACFSTFGDWGADARLRTGFARRKDARSDWEPGWDAMFTHEEDVGVTPGELRHFRVAYSSILAALARDIELLAARDRYATADVSLNAH